MATNQWTWVFVGLLIAAFVAYTAGITVLRRREVAPLAPVALVAASIQLGALAAPLLLSGDAWAYWSYGRIAAVHGGNPYVDEPARYPADPAYQYVSPPWRKTTSVYGPAFTLASEPIALAAGTSPAAAAWFYKTLGAVGVLAAALLASVRARRPAFAVALIGWNPLLAVQFGGGGHNDAVAIALVVGGIALERVGHPLTAGAAWASAVASKWLPVLLLPIRYVNKRGGRICAFTIGLLLTGLALVAAGTLRYGWHWLGAFEPLARNASEGTKYALPHRLEELGLPHSGALACAATAFLVGYGWLLWSARRGCQRRGMVALLVVLTSPWLVPWYAIWPLALAAADEDLASQVGALALCAYVLPQRVLI